MFRLQVQPAVNIESDLCSSPASSTPSIPAETILPPPSIHVKPPKSPTTLSRPLLFENEMVCLALAALLQIPSQFYTRAIAYSFAGFQIDHTPRMSSNMYICLCVCVFIHQLSWLSSENGWILCH